MLTTKQKTELKKLDRKWMRQQATTKEIKRCNELRRMRDVTEPAS